MKKYNKPRAARNAKFEPTPVPTNSSGGDELRKMGRRTGVESRQRKEFVLAELIDGITLETCQCSAVMTADVSDRTSKNWQRDFGKLVCYDGNVLAVPPGKRPIAPGRLSHSAFPKS